jgi:hypothetical protein
MSFAKNKTRPSWNDCLFGCGRTLVFRWRSSDVPCAQERICELRGAGFQQEETRRSRAGFLSVCGLVFMIIGMPPH